MKRISLDRIKMFRGKEGLIEVLDGIGVFRPLKRLGTDAESAKFADFYTVIKEGDNKTWTLYQAVATVVTQNGEQYTDAYAFEKATALAKQMNAWKARQAKHVRPIEGAEHQILEAFKTADGEWTFKGDGEISTAPEVPQNRVEASADEHAGFRQYLETNVVDMKKYKKNAAARARRAQVKLQVA